MEKLGKTFTKKYNFKRLLQTAPDTISRYKRHEDAINSIEPHKHIQLITYESLKPVPEFDPDSAIDMNAVADIETFGPGASMWPKRIKFAEQILDLYANNYHVWAVEICGEIKVGSPMPNIEVTKFQKPIIAHHNPIMRDMPNRRNCRQIFNQRKLAKIDDEGLDTAYFLIADEDNTNTLTHLRQCSIIPDGWNIYGAAFYDRGIAYLYADSLRKHMKKWVVFQKQRI